MASSSSFLVLISLVGLLLLSGASFIESKSIKPGTFWQEFDQLYGNKIDSVIDEKINTISNRRILRQDTQNQVSTHENIDDEPSDIPGLDIMGRGFNFVKGESSIPLFQWKRNHHAKYHSPYTKRTYDVPDDIFVVNTPELSGHEEAGVFSYVEDYQTNLANQYGVNASYSRYGFGLTEDVKALREVMTSVSRTYGAMERVYVLNTMSLLPLQYLTVDPHVTNLLNLLPRFDVTTKHAYYNLFEQVGTHFIHNAAFGGSMQLQQVFETKRFRNFTQTTVLDLLSLKFDFISLHGIVLRNQTWEELVEDNSTTVYNVTSFKGGDPTVAFQFNQYKEWAETLKYFPVPVRYRLVEISELVTDLALKADIKKAIATYAADLLATDASFKFGPAMNYADPTLGAQVFSASSVNHDCYTTEACGRCWLFWTCCKNTTNCVPRNNQPNLIADEQTGGDFTFNDNDRDQSVVLDLGYARRVLRVEADVTPAGRLNEVWDYIEVFTSNDNYIWQPFGIKGKKDGIPDILEAENYISRSMPVSAQFIKISFGSCSIHNGLGSSVRRVRVLGVESSQPVGHLETITQGAAVVGWAFDPLDLSSATVEVYVNGKLHASGRPSLVRPDIASRFDLASDAIIGFNIPLALDTSTNVHQIYVKFVGVGGGSLTTNTLQKFIAPPAGKLFSVTPTSVIGWALDVANPSQSVTVDILVNGMKQISAMTTETDDQLNQLLGVEGAHVFKADLSALNPGIHTITARATVNGEQRALANSLTLDLRPPLGKIETLNEKSVSGWAIDPSVPSSQSTVQLFINNQFVAEQQTSILRQDVNKFYSTNGAHGFDISFDVQLDTSYEVAVYILLGDGHLALVDSQKVFVDSPSNRDTSILGPIGIGFDIVYEEFRLPVVALTYSNGVVVDLSAMLNNSEYASVPEPDQVQLHVNLGNILNETSAIYNTTKDYITKHADAVGAKEWLYVGIFQVSDTTRNIASLFDNAYTVVASYERSVSLFNVLLLPPPLLSFDTYAQGLVNNLPAYTNETEAQYRAVIQQLGTHYLSRMTLGGKVSSLTAIDTTKMNISSENDLTQQVRMAFNYRLAAAGSIAKARYEESLSSEFIDGSKSTFRYVGGHPEMYRLDESEEWATTVIDNPVVIEYQLELISSLVTDATKRRDLQQAIVDYISSASSL
eukprot:TRINITY_DN4936_c0_g1_i1.p1 TRINITY_DN4936_c0_g1~~TRINITY_DN4936_c0_g1_i1.p1  ORF type:complete len:1173 (+),score=320.49 TRINITY_DN4936_c0_g1_i1:56-3574(+)